MNNDKVRLGRVIFAVWLVFAVSQAIHYVVEHCTYKTAYWCFTAACPLVALAIVLIYIEIRRYGQSLQNDEE